MPATDPDRLHDRLDPVGRHRQPGEQHGPRLGRAVQHDPALRGRALAAAHPGDLRGRRRARLRPPVSGARSSRSRSGWARPGTPTSPRPPVPRPKQQLLATGGNWDFAPVQDLARDNRWGRYYETWAEEPALAAALGAANIRGLQGGGFDSPQVAATVKHFAGYSQSINGHDRVEAQLPIRYLQDIFLPSYAGGIDAGACDRDGRLRLDQQRPGDRVALPAHRGAAPPARLQGRRDQRLRRRARRCRRPTTSRPTSRARSRRP